MEADAIRNGIKERFFMALDTLSANKVIRGVGTFARLYNINKSNLLHLRYKEDGTVKSEYLYYIIRDFGINSQWLITGVGPMFADKELAISAIKKGMKKRAKSTEKCENACPEEK